MRFALPAVATVAVAAALAVPALANASGTAPKPALKSTTTTVNTVTTDHGKYPGDPYTGKCVFALKGDSRVQECAAANGR